ncbi:MAG: S9 family peptidase [Thermoprotei archaeon]
MKKVEPEDLYRFKLVHQVASNGKLIAFVVGQAEKDEYKRNIWLSDGEKVWQLTRGDSDFHPKWSPDGRQIAFLSRRSMKQEEKGARLMVIDASGGEAWEITKGEIADFYWSPSGDRMYFLMSVGKADDDVKVINRIPIWFNDKGYTYGKRTHLFSVSVSGGEPSQITSGDLDVTSFAVSDDGRLAVSIKANDLRPYESEIKIMSNGNWVTLGPRLSISSIRWGRGGLLVIGNDLHRGTVTHDHLLFLSMDGKVNDLMAGSDLEVGNSLNSDMRGSSPESKVEPFGPDLIFTASARGSVNLFAMSQDGVIRKLTDSNWSVESFSAKGDIIAFAAMTDYRPAELYVIRDGAPNKVTGFNDDIISQLNLVRPQHFTFRASDGEVIDGWKMVSEKAGRRPAVLAIHGGPKTMYGYAFMFEFQLLAQDHVVIYMNPRGSSGYSEQFADIRGHYGERDYQDIMEGLESAISSTPEVDPERVGVEGGSYGGFMVNWIITHTDRFKAAISERSISNWVHFFGTSDIGFYFANDHVGGSLSADPWSNPSLFYEKSPIFHVDAVKTPVMIIHSLEDYRCYVGEALQLFTSLVYKGKEAKLVLFPGESHELSRSGKPDHRVQRLKIIRQWFAEKLLATP